MELNSKLKPVLQNIHFCERYKLLSEENQFSNNDKGLDSEIVLNLIKDLGYQAKFNKNESFYKVTQKQNEYKFQFNISLRHGNVELIWDVLETNVRLNIGGPWGVVYKSVSNKEERPLMPKFRNYADLEAILKEAFSIYEDFKKELLNSKIE